MQVQTIQQPFSAYDAQTATLYLRDYLGPFDRTVVARCLLDAAGIRQPDDDPRCVVCLCGKPLLVTPPEAVAT